MKWQDYIFYGLVLFLAFKIVSKISGSFGKSKEEQAEEKNKQELISKTTAQENEVLAKVKPSITLSQAKQYADEIEGAISGLGTDEQTIYRIFQNIKGDSDYILISQHFGKRGLPMMKEGMAEYIRSGLTTKELKWLNDILKKRGITYRF